MEQDKSGLINISLLKRERLTEQIADQIQDYITVNKLAAGTRLPPGRELAVRFGVSRATLSEAIRLVGERGLLQRIVGSGTYVIDKSRSAFVDSMERLFLHSSSSYDDLMTFRDISEPNIAALAAERATAEDIEEIKGFLEKAEDAWKQNLREEHVAADAHFHEALAKATHNELLIAAMAGIQRLLRNAIDAQHRVSHSQDYERGILSHRPVFDALVNRDPERARAAMEKHMIFTRQAVERVSTSSHS